MYSNEQKEAVGIRVVSQFIRESWDCRWQEFNARNDNGVDGIAIMRKSSKETGGVVFIQVKCGGDGYRQDQAQHPDKICINLGKKYIDVHKPRWNKTPGPCVIIFVDDTINRRNPPAWWTDLKDSSSYSETNKGMLLIPKNQKFGEHTKGEFHKLCGSAPVDRTLSVITTTIDDIVFNDFNKTLRCAAREFYVSWSKNYFPTENPKLGKIFINRVGWRHITKNGRKIERIVQSFSLLGVAKKLIEQIDDIDMLGRAKVEQTGNRYTKITDYLGIRANIIFPHRHQSVVQVVLLRSRLINPITGVVKQKIWFLSVYELRRGVQQN